MKTPYGLKQGGLMRCCLLTLDDAMVERSDAEPLQEGETLNCIHCDNPMIYHEGYWQWNHPPISSVAAGAQSPKVGESEAH